MASDDSGDERGMHTSDSSLSTRHSSSATNPFEFGNPLGHQGAEVSPHIELLLWECFRAELLLLREHFRVARLRAILNVAPKLLPAPSLETIHRWNCAPNINTHDSAVLLEAYQRSIAQVGPEPPVAASAPAGDSFDCSFASGQTSSAASEGLDLPSTETSMIIVPLASTLPPSLQHSASFVNIGSCPARFFSHPVGLVVDSASRYLGAEALHALLLWFLTDDGKALSKERSTARFLSDLRARLEPSEATTFIQDLRTTMLLVFRSVWHISNVSLLSHQPGSHSHLC